MRIILDNMRTLNRHNRMESVMNYFKATLVALVAASAPTLAHAGAKCEAHPRAEWMPEDQARAKLEADGYTIKIFKVDGQCYEIYGRNKDGKKVEIYFDTKTLAAVKSEIEK